MKNHTHYSMPHCPFVFWLFMGSITGLVMQLLGALFVCIYKKHRKMRCTYLSEWFTSFDYLHIGHTLRLLYF